MQIGVVDAKAPKGMIVLLTGIAAVGFVIAAVAVTFRLNMGDIRSGWPVTLWRVTMFGLFLSIVLALIVPILRRKWFGTVLTGLIAVLALMTLGLAIGTASESIAGLVLTLPTVIVLLGLAGVLAMVFHSHISRYGHDPEHRRR